MSEKKEEKLLKIVNSSGFPLQIGIQNLIEKQGRDYGWEILSSEHPWHNVETGNNGFIDLVLKSIDDIYRIVIECKRVRDTKWIFLVPSSKEKKRRHAIFWNTKIKNKKTENFGWVDVAIDPESFESEFCIVLGQDNKSKPMLERIAAELVEATEAVAYEEYQLIKEESYATNNYFTVIVTTAELHVCKFNPEDISITNGELDTAEFEVVPFVRFRKSLTTKQKSLKGIKSIKDLNKAKERTVFVVNSLNIEEFIAGLASQ